MKEAIELAKRLDEQLALASGHALLGQLYEHIDNHEMADKEFRVAIRLLGAEGRTDRLAETHAAYAEMLDARGDGRMASRQWKQAAKLALQRRPAALHPRAPSSAVPRAWARIISPARGASSLTMPRL